MILSLLADKRSHNHPLEPRGDKSRHRVSEGSLLDTTKGDNAKDITCITERVTSAHQVLVSTLHQPVLEILEGSIRQLCFNLIHPWDVGKAEPHRFFTRLKLGKEGNE